MAEQNDSKHEQTLNHANQEDPGTAQPVSDIDSSNIGAAAGSQHNDWGHSQAGAAGNEQSAQSGQQSGSGGNIGGVPGSQHNDWGHSPVATDANLQSGDGGNAQSAQSPRQGVMPGEEMGHLQRGQGDDGQKP